MPSDEIHLVEPGVPLETQRVLLEPLMPAHAPERLQDEAVPIHSQGPSCLVAGVGGSPRLSVGAAFPDGRKAWLNWAVRERCSGDIALVESLGFERDAFHKNADHFKGSSSDEYHYELEGSAWAEKRARF